MKKMGWVLRLHLYYFSHFPYDNIYLIGFCFKDTPSEKMIVLRLTSNLNNLLRNVKKLKLPSMDKFYK